MTTANPLTKNYRQQCIKIIADTVVKSTVVASINFLVT